MTQLLRVKQLLSRVSCTCLGKSFSFIISYDKRSDEFESKLYLDREPRVFIQLEYSSECTKGGEKDTWKGRKWYLSEYMTDDEIIKTAYSAFEFCIKHEIMEGFKVDNITLFNPHVNFEELLLISNKEVTRNDSIKPSLSRKE